MFKNDIKFDINNDNYDYYNSSYVVIIMTIIIVVSYNHIKKTPQNF